MKDNEQDNASKIISYIDRNKKVKLHTNLGNITIKHLEKRLYIIIVHYANNKKLLIGLKVLHQYIREHENELSIIGK